MSNSVSATEILKSCVVTVSPESFSIVSLSKDSWTHLLSDPSRSPRMTSPFLIFMDRHEVTLILDDIDLANARSGLGQAQIESEYRLLTFETSLDLTVVGFMAVVSSILADAFVPILAISAFSRDHLLLKQKDLAAALKALGPHVKDLC